MVVFKVDNNYYIMVFIVFIVFINFQVIWLMLNYYYWVNLIWIYLMMSYHQVIE